MFANDVVSFIATDSHSMQKRPPLLKNALEKIATEYGDEIKQKLINNAKNLYLEIVNKDESNDI